MQNFQPYLTLFFRLPIALCCPKMTDNVVAASRRRGVSVRLGREQTMMLPALCQTRMHPRLRETAR